MSKLAVGVMLLCAAGIGWVINESVEQNAKLNILVCADRAVLAEQGPIRVMPEGVYLSYTGKSYTPTPGSVCLVEVFE